MLKLEIKDIWKTLTVHIIMNLCYDNALLLIICLKWLEFVNISEQIPSAKYKTKSVNLIVCLNCISKQIEKTFDKLKKIINTTQID